MSLHKSGSTFQNKIYSHINRIAGQQICFSRAKINWLQVLYSKHEELKNDMKAVCASMAKIVGEFPKDVNPNKYVFIVQHVESGGGGIEHLNSTVLVMPRFNYSSPTKYRSFMNLVAHEYFHLWHVKRIRPVNLGPFDYDNENYTHSLWVAEGITSYYD